MGPGVPSSERVRAMAIASLDRLLLKYGWEYIWAASNQSVRVTALAMSTSTYSVCILKSTSNDSTVLHGARLLCNDE